MYKFIKEKFDEIFTKENIRELVNFYNTLSYNVKKQTNIYNRDGYSNNYAITDYDYRNFKEQYELLEKNSIFSNYFIELEFNSLLDLDTLNEDIIDIPEFYVLRLNDTRIVLKTIDSMEEKPTTNLKDVDALKLKSSTNFLLENNGKSEDTLATELSGRTYNSTLEQKQKLQTMSQEYHSTKKTIEEEQHKDLEKLRIEKERILNEIKAKKKSLLDEMQKKELALKQKMLEIKKEMAIMDAEMYDIQSFLGETYELIQVRSGKSASLNQPFTINQKIRFLDEDLPILISLYGSDFDKDNHDNLINAFKYSDKLVDYFCQTDKSITFFRLSRENRVVEGFNNCRKNNNDRGRTAKFYIEPIIKEKGHDFVGFVIKNGENLYFGVLDKGSRIIVDENIFYDINAPEPKVDIDKMTETQFEEFRKKQAKDRMARKFIFSILQGLIDNKKVISFDEPVNIFTLSPQIIFSSAAGRISTKIYGEFVWLKDKLNRMTRAEDTVFVHNMVNDSNRIEQYFNYQPNIEVIFGINKVEKVELSEKGKKVFIKTKREGMQWDVDNVNCNIEVFMDEFINIEYMNSKWIEYFISIRATDNTLQGSHFSVMAKNWMVIRDALLKRELQEAENIKKYYPNLDDTYNWQIKLSEWKLQQKNPVRSITDYQAKRFAKALIEDTIKPMPFFYQEAYEELTEKYYLTAPSKQLDADFDIIADKINDYVMDSIRMFNDSTEENKEFSIREMHEYFNEVAKEKEVWQNHSKEKNVITFDDVFYGKFNSSLMTKEFFDEIFTYGVELAVKKVLETDLKDDGKIDTFFRKHEINVKDFSEFKRRTIQAILIKEKEISKFLSNEAIRFNKEFSYDLIGNRDTASKTLKLLNTVIENGVNTISNETHIELIKKLIELESLPDFIYNNGFERISSAKVGSASMSPDVRMERERLLSSAKDVIAFATFYKQGYYDIYHVYDRSKLDRIYYHWYLKLMGRKYNLAVDAVNSYPFFRVNYS